MQDKAVAADGQPTVSGWSPPPEGFAKATPEEVLAHSKKIGHTPKPAGGLDQTNRGGFSGKYNSSHAEKQQAVIAPNKPVAVDLPMCDDCQAFYQKQAIYTKTTQVVTDPNGTWTFHPNGLIEFTFKK
jgi:hypothetical protein